MSKRLKIIVSVVMAIFMLAAGTIVPVMAQEETTPPEAGARGLLARVAEILDIPQDDLSNAFNQAQQEMRQEAFEGALDKAVEKGRLTQEKANEIKEWCEQKPEVTDRGLLQHAFSFRLRNHLPGDLGGWHWGRPRS